MTAPARTPPTRTPPCRSGPAADTGTPGTRPAAPETAGPVRTPAGAATPAATSSHAGSPRTPAAATTTATSPGRPSAGGTAGRRAGPRTPPCPDGPARPRVRRAAYEPGRGTARPRVVPTGDHRVPVLPQHPDAREALGRVLRIAGEVLDGRRPESHLAAHADPAVLRCWRVAAGRRRRRSPARLGPLRIDHPRDGAAEVAAVLHVDGTVRALAARFDLTGGRWRWTAVRLG